MNAIATALVFGWLGAALGYIAHALLAMASENERIYHVCAWCKRVEDQHGFPCTTSHGICRECTAKQEKETAIFSSNDTE